MAALRVLIAAVVAVGLMVPAAWARDVTDAEKSALISTVGAFDTAMRSNDFEGIIAIIPPKIFAKMAADNNLTIEQLHDAAIAASKQTMETVSFESFGMDVEQARYASAGDDLPYALIPTETVMKIGEDKIKATGDTLALLDEGTWYLVRVSEAPQADLLKAVYPAFADVAFAPGTMEKVEE